MGLCSLDDARVGRVALERCQCVLPMRRPPQGLWNHQHAHRPPLALLLRQRLLQRQRPLLCQGQVSRGLAFLGGLWLGRLLRLHQGSCGAGGARSVFDTAVAQQAARRAAREEAAAEARGQRLGQQALQLPLREGYVKDTQRLAENSV